MSILTTYRVMAELNELTLEDEPDVTPADEGDALSELEAGDEAELELEGDAVLEGEAELGQETAQELAPESASEPVPELVVESAPEMPDQTAPSPITEAEPAPVFNLQDTPPTGSSIQSNNPAPDGMAASSELTDAFAQILNAFSQLFDVLPDWAAMAIAAFIAVIIGIVIGGRIGRRKEPKPETPTEQAPTVRAALPAPENPAFKNYQVFLETKGVSAKERDAQMRAFSERYREMRQNLRDLLPGNKELAEQVELVRDALDAGDFDRTFVLLTRIGNKENTDGLEKRQAALKHLMAAAVAKSVAGDLQMSRLEYESAADNFRQAVEALPPFQEDLHAEYLNKYGTASYQAGHHETAIAAFERALQILEKRLGKNHPDVATALNNLALLHYSRGNYDAAEPLYKRSLAIDEQTLGIDHTGVATDLNNLALLYKKKGNLEEAEPLLRRAMEIKEKNFDPGHPSLVTGLRNYASLLRSLGREEEADIYERRATVLPPSRTGVAAE